MSDADTIEVVDYDPNWALFFANEAERITGALKQFNLKSVQHIGGTAVVGLAAKPVIDILVEIGNPDETARVKTALIALGYAEKPPGPDADLLFCIKRAEDQRRTHHVHVVPTREAPDTRVVFRNLLCTHAEYAKAYERLKRQLATEFRNDRLAYMDGKNKFIQALLLISSRQPDRS